MFKMGKNQSQDSKLQFNKNVPGCFWSIFHTIDYHRWNNVKKMLPYKKHSRSKGGPKSTPNNHHLAEVSEQSNDGNNPLMCTAESCPIRKKPGEAHVNEVITKEMSEEDITKFWKLNSSSKRRLIRTQSIHHLEPSYDSPGYNGENGDNGVTPRQKTPMKLAASGMRSISLNAMDNEDYFIQGKIAIRLKSFTEKSNGAKKTLETNNNRNVSGRSFKEDTHIQEIFKANRKLFAELLKGARGKNTLQSPQNKKSSASLAKSRSFPAPGLAGKGYKKLTSLQHKQYESFPKQKSNYPHPSKLVESESPKNFHEDSTPCDSDSTSSHNIREQTTPSSLGSNRGLRHGGWNQLVVKRFNIIKQKIRRSFKERKKGNNQKTSKVISTVNCSAHELPLSRKDRPKESIGTATSENISGIRRYSETGNSENDNISNGVLTKTGIASPSASLERYSQLSDDSGIIGYSETDNSENDNLSNRDQTKIGTASLSASLKRYSQLSEYSFDKNREAKCYDSLTLRLINEKKIPNIEKPKKTFGRNLSSPDIDLFCTLFTDPPRAVSRTKKSKRGLAHSSTYNNIRTDENLAHILSIHVFEPLNRDSPSMIEKGNDNMPVDHSGSLNEVTNDEGTAWVDELEEKLPHLDISNGKHQQVLGSECIVEDVRETVDHFSDHSHINQVLELETCFQDDETSELSDSEGAILKSGCSIANELEPSDDQPNESRTGGALPTFETIVNDEIIDDAEKIPNYLHLHSELSRIDSADFNYMRYILQLSSFIESGHIIDQQLNPSIFAREEAHFYKKLECYWEMVDNDSDHLLLLDLVYETLHNVYENSFIGFLKTFSSTSQIRPMPLGLYLLEEVRGKVAWYLSLGPELDQCLDDVVGRDLSKGDDWMNLQSETDYITLELEDLILDELLDEVLSF
ncbi:uncharacterized protein LOC120073877 isoform X2 [Benincasa hispida]|uniref:uncharacterized protein LOC120073877 isoform X2 n=2 Tax=Benincasa hispida TaxID=102211 RepID=UPI00190286DB|nr:uncharacterized protein LOC120073877 isoform X2 [Benincasa hispida]